jgi:hypothetical protein
MHSNEQTGSLGAEEDAENDCEKMELTFERVLLGHLELLWRAQQMQPGGDRQPPLAWEGAAGARLCCAPLF